MSFGYDPKWDEYRQTQIDIQRKVEEDKEKRLQDYRSEYGTPEKEDAVDKNRRYAQRKKSASKSRATTVKMRRRGKHSFTDKKGNVFRITYRKKLKKNRNPTREFAADQRNPTLAADQRNPTPTPDSSPDSSPVIDHITMRPVGENYLKVMKPDQLDHLDRSIRKELPKIIQELKKKDFESFQYDPPLASATTFYPEGGPEYIKAKHRFDALAFR